MLKCAARHALMQLRAYAVAAHRHLMEADVDKCAARRAAVARVGALEADVAGACGLAMVYCTPGLRTTPEYAAFLTRLAGGAHRRGSLRMQAKRLCVMCGAT